MDINLSSLEKGLETLSIVNLKKLCKESKIKGYSNKGKKELISLLEKLKVSEETSETFKEPKETSESLGSFRPISLSLNKKISKINRQENGIFFTPKEARTIIFDYLKTLNYKPKNCLEPSFGSGEFIQDVLEKYPESNITGIEKHPIIFEEVSKQLKKSEKLTLKNQDFLEYNEPSKSFDLIIGNPPYFVIEKEKAKSFSSIFSGRPNIFVLFIYKCLTQMLEKDGICAFVLPTSFYNCSYYEPCRRYIYEHCTLLKVENISVSYLDTNQDTMILIIKNTKSESSDFILKFNEKIIINPFAKELKELLKDSVSLENLHFKVKTGEVVWNQHKEKLTNDNSGTLNETPKSSSETPEVSLLIYSHNIKDNKLVLDLTKEDKKQYIKDFKKKDSNETKGPALCISRGYGNKYKLNYVFIDENISFYGENHINVIYPDTEFYKEKSEIIKVFERIKKSLENENTSKFISMYVGNGALSKTELETLFPIF